MENAARPSRPRGRPRAFDRDAALDVAVRVFWEAGYAATSVNDLADAMGISLSSLYAAFGDKAALFREAVGRYQAWQGGYVAEALALSPTRLAAERLLEGAVERYTQPTMPTGCLVLLNGINAVTEPGVAAFLADQGASFKHLIAARLKAGQGRGDPLPAPPDALATYLVLLVTGIAIAARQGVSRHELRSMVALAMQGWPA